MCLGLLRPCILPQTCDVGYFLFYYYLVPCVVVPRCYQYGVLVNLQRLCAKSQVKTQGKSKQNMKAGKLWNLPLYYIPDLVIIPEGFAS